MREATDDKWVPTICYMCYNCCGIEAHVVNGVIVEVRGNRECPSNFGKLCAKGLAGIMSLYDPYRVRFPLIRTYPKKGAGIDPVWKRISWDEALDRVVGKLSKIREDDPRKLVMAGLDFNQSTFHGVFGSCFGTPNRYRPSGYFCGNAIHPVQFLTQGSFYSEPDLDYCNYCMLIGTQEGFMVNHTAVLLAQKMADARSRGMKLVVVDPICSVAASKADEWVPIRPGTDGAFALAVLNILLNDLKIYDAQFIKKHTNGPYLIGRDGYYIRHVDNRKPMVWDLSDNRAKVYDDSEILEPALEGYFAVNDTKCQPSFSLLKEHVKSYEPERVSEITTIPAHMILRLAEEFGKAARIGSSILIDGKELPYRPVAVVWMRGSTAHKQSLMSGLAMNLLNVIVGAIGVPGGLQGNMGVGPFWSPKEGPDGLLVPDPMQIVVAEPYPARKVKAPETLDLGELFPVACYSDTMFVEAVLQSQKYGLPYKPEAMLLIHSNPMMSTADPDKLAEVLRQIPFIASFSSHLDETAVFADIVLPDAHYMEKLVPFPNSRTQGMAVGPGSWYWLMAQPVVEPALEVRPWAEVLLEIGDRLGILGDINAVLNISFHLKAPYKLDPEKKHNLEEISDIWAKSWFGPERGLAWFKDHSFLISSRKKVEEVYPRSFMKARIPIYLEHLKQAGEELRSCIQALGISWDLSSYHPLPNWIACPAYGKTAGELDLYAVNYKLPFHTLSFTAQNPWLDEISDHHPWAYRIIINSEVAKNKGVKDNDTIWVESSTGKTRGRARLTQCIHPEVIGIAGTFGHWAGEMPIAKGKGVHFNALLDSGFEKIDGISAALDSCVKVKVYKAR